MLQTLFINSCEYKYGKLNLFRSLPMRSMLWLSVVSPGIRRPPICMCWSWMSWGWRGSTCGAILPIERTGTKGRAVQEYQRRCIGGCVFAEDPDLDARDANPSWLPQPAKVVSLMQRSSSDSVGQPFCLWRMAGRKALVLEDADILLTVHQGQRIWRYALSPDLSDGERYAFSVPCDAQTRHRLDAVNDAILAMEQGPTARAPNGLKIVGKHRYTRFCGARLADLIER